MKQHMGIYKNFDVVVCPNTQLKSVHITIQCKSKKKSFYVFGFASYHLKFVGNTVQNPAEIKHFSGWKLKIVNNCHKKCY